MTASHSTNPQILAGALEAFAEHGYHGTSIRTIARAAGLSVPGVYHHYPSKQAILADLIEVAIHSLTDRSLAALGRTESTSSRFDALVEAMIRFHMEHRAEAFVASSELRSLEPVARDRAVSLRDRQQGLLLEVIQDGCDEGVFATPFPRDTARAISTLCVGVAAWYRPTGELSPGDLVERQLVLARRLVGLT